MHNFSCILHMRQKIKIIKKRLKVLVFGTKRRVISGTVLMHSDVEDNDVTVASNSKSRGTFEKCDLMLGKVLDF